MKKEKFQLQGKSLKILRLNNGMKAVKVAEVLDVTKAYISMCESNQRKLSEAKTKEFLELIGTSEDEAKAFVQIVGK